VIGGRDGDFTRAKHDVTRYEENGTNEEQHSEILLEEGEV